MTITFPRPLPLTDQRRMSECWFDLIDNVSSSPSGNGAVMNLSQVVDPAWQGVFQTAILERDQRALWSSWHKSLRGGFRKFIAYDVRHAAPLAYPGANLPGDISAGWNGQAGVSAVGSSGALGLTGLPAAYKFTAGDRIGLEQNGRYGYYEIVEDATASSGGVVTVTVVPFLHTAIFTTSAVCRVWRAVCQFIVDASTWSESGIVEKTPISFKAVQSI